MSFRFKYKNYYKYRYNNFTIIRNKDANKDKTNIFIVKVILFIIKNNAIL